MNFFGFKIGDTSFYQVPEISKWLTVDGRTPVVYVKREDENEPHHTVKARAAAAVLKQYEKMDNIIFADITCSHMGREGNTLCHAYRTHAGKEMYFASIVDRNISKRAKRQLSRHDGLVIEMPITDKELSTADKIELVKSRIKKPLNVVPVGKFETDNVGYRALAKELYDAKLNKDDILFLPLGDGNLLYNTGSGLEETGDMPRIVAATTYANLFSGHEGHNEAVPGLDVKFSPLEEPVQDFIKKHDIPVITPSDEEIQEAYRYVSDVAKIPTCREAAVAFAVAKKYAKDVGFKNGEKVVIVNTGYEQEGKVSMYGPDYRPRYQEILKKVAKKIDKEVKAGISYARDLVADFSSDFYKLDPEIWPEKTLKRLDKIGTYLRKLRGNVGSLDDNLTYYFDEILPVQQEKAEKLGRTAKRYAVPLATVPLLTLVGSQVSWDFMHPELLAQWHEEGRRIVDSMTVRSMENTPKMADVVAFAEYKALSPEVLAEKQDSVRDKVKSTLDLSNWGWIEYQMLVDNPKSNALYQQFLKWQSRMDSLRNRYR
ncbi:MAG: pyridoxal-phosphate dependent enzyme [Candidatus Aenigmarchaeota archaeon]|nr:pyridoxal-phosphate dependent enzyme [Candidatus Aenigmarchaeota archaeon]